MFGITNKRALLFSLVLLYTRCQAGSRSLVFDLSIAHDRFGSSSHVQQNGCLSHPQDREAPLRIAVQRKIAAYQQQYADNQKISFLPAIVTTSTRMHGEFLRLLFLQAHRETEAAVHRSVCVCVCECVCVCVWSHACDNSYTIDDLRSHLSGL